jgi:hypothetical protein
MLGEEFVGGMAIRHVFLTPLPVAGGLQAWRIQAITLRRAARFPRQQTKK